MRKSKEEYDIDRDSLLAWADKQKPSDTPVTWTELEVAAKVPAQGRHDRTRIMRTLRTRTALWVAVPGIGVKLLGAVPGEVGQSIQLRANIGSAHWDAASRIGSAATAKLGRTLSSFDRMMRDAADQWRSIRAQLVTPLLADKDEENLDHEDSDRDVGRDKPVQSKQIVRARGTASRKREP